MQYFRQIGMLLSVLLFYAGLQGQTLLRVVDRQTGEGLPFANLCFESLAGNSKQYATTGAAGTYEFSGKEPCKLAVSYLGYDPVIDTLIPGVELLLKMDVAINRVDEVIVTGQFKPVMADKSIYRVEVMGRDQIEARAATNLGELLTTDLSFRTSNSSALGTGLSMQGLDGEAIKILVDGVPVIGRQNGMIDLGQLSLANADHIETVKGPMSVVYGSNAMAGAINIITKKGSREKFRALGSGYYETVGVYNFDASLATNSKNNSLSLSGSRNFFAGYSPAEMGRFKLWKPKQQYNLSADWGYTKGPWNTHLNHSWFDEEVRDKDSLQAPRYERALDRYYYTTRHTSKLDIARSLGKNGGIDLTTAFSFYRKTKKATVNDLVNLQETLAAPAQQDTTTFRNAMLRTSFHNLLGDKIEYQAGLDLNYDDVTGKRIEGKKEITDMAGFFSLQWQLSDKLNVQPGIRGIYNSKFDAPLVYALSALWNSGEKFQVRASVGRGFRSPTIKELYLNFQDINHNVTGNEDLSPEYSWNYNLSCNGKTTLGMITISGDLALFHNRMLDKIDFIYKLDDPTWAKYFNINGLSKSQGIEARMGFAFHPRFKLNLGGTLVGRSKLSDLESFYYHNDFTADWTYHNLKYDFSIAMFYKFTDKMYTAVANFDENMQVVDKIYEWYQSDFNTLDLTVSRPFFNKHLTLACGAKNLLDVKNVFSSGGSGGGHSGGGGELPMAWGRTYFLRCSWQFSKR